MSQTDPEYDDIPEREQFILFIITRSIDATLAVFYLIFLIILFSLKAKFTFQVAISLQIILSAYIRCTFTLFPIINTAELEASWMCTAQTVLYNIAFFSQTLNVLTILIMTYYNLSKPESLNKNKKCKQISIFVFNWVLSLGLSSIFFFTKNQANPVGNCRGEGPFARLFLIGWYILIFVISNVLICKMIMALRPFMKNKDNYQMIKKYLEKFLLFNLPFIVGMISMVLRLLRKTMNNNFYYLIVREVFQEISNVIFIFVYCFTQTVTEKIKQILCCKKALENEIRRNTVIRLMDDERPSNCSSNIEEDKEDI